MLQQAMKSTGINLQFLPLGRLTKSTIARAKEILVRILEKITSISQQTQSIPSKNLKPLC
jgi:hypothetical protein